MDDVLKKLQQLAVNEAYERVNTALNNTINHKFKLISMFSGIDKSDLIAKEFNADIDFIIKDLRSAKKWLEPCSES